jgi:hypothetical protein
MEMAARKKRDLQLRVVALKTVVTRVEFSARIALEVNYSVTTILAIY